MRQIAYFSDSLYKEHNPGSFHPERPQRISSVWSYLDEHPLKHVIKHGAVSAASGADVRRVHSNTMIDAIMNTRGKEQTILDIGDTIAGPRSAEVSLMACGQAKAAVDAVFSDKFDRAFVACRPPGHHAESNRIMGFCLFNTIAVAAAYALNKGLAKKILIVDWDVHHGNGTQDIFYGSADVFYLSLHQWPLFPGSGSATEKGRGPGESYTLNYPLRAGLGDEAWCDTLKTGLDEAVYKFKPDLVMISAGFDANFKDPIGGMQVSEEGFADMTRFVSSVANTHCSGRLVSVLEGGYDLNGLPASVHAHLLALGEQ